MAFQAIASKTVVAGKPVVTIQRGPRTVQSLPLRLVVEAAAKTKAKAQVSRVARKIGFYFIKIALFAEGSI